MEAKARKRLLTYNQVREKIPYTRQHLGRLEKAGLFPKRIRLGANRVAWIEAEIDEHIDAAAARRAA
jgi:prophage regulatory protein